MDHCPPYYVIMLVTEFSVMSTSCESDSDSDNSTTLKESDLHTVSYSFLKTSEMIIVQHQNLTDLFLSRKIGRCWCSSPMTTLQVWVQQRKRHFLVRLFREEEIKLSRQSYSSTVSSRRQTWLSRADCSQHSALWST